MGAERMMNPTMKKNDLISRKVLLDSEESFMRLAECRSYDTPYNSPAYTRYVTQASERRNFVERLKTAPAVDAAPVLHGLWYQEIGDVHSTGKYRNCSICKENVFIPYFSKQGINNIDFDYCPNCGARMDGKDDEK